MKSTGLTLDTSYLPFSWVIYPLVGRPSGEPLRNRINYLPKCEGKIGPLKHKSYFQHSPHRSWRDDTSAKDHVGGGLDFGRGRSAHGPPPNGPRSRFRSRKAWPSAHFKVRPLFPNKRLTC